MDSEIISMHHNTNSHNKCGNQIIQPHDERLVLVSEDSTSKLWDIKCFKCISIKNKMTILRVRQSHNNTLVYIEKDKLIVYDIKEEKLIQKMQKNNRLILDLDLLHNGFVVR